MAARELQAHYPCMEATWLGSNVETELAARSPNTGSSATPQLQT